MTDKALLEITCCNQCPNMFQERYYTADSWEHVMEWKCKEANNQRIAFMEWNDKDPAIPSFCPLIKTEPVPEPYSNHLDSCVYRIEANSNEELGIWSRFSDPDNFFKHDKRYSWDFVFGWLETIGHLDDRPICVSMSIVKLDGYPVLFWHPTSQLVDYAMIDEWFKEHCPNMDSTDGTNAAHAFHEIERLKEAK